ncbi:MAG: hypothetical protein V4576_01940 [Patescibacteria group bacterium]
MKWFIIIIILIVIGVTSNGNWTTRADIKEVTDVDRKARELLVATDGDITKLRPSSKDEILADVKRKQAEDAKPELNNRLWRNPLTGQMEVVTSPSTPPASSTSTSTTTTSTTTSAPATPQPDTNRPAPKEYKGLTFEGKMSLDPLQRLSYNEPSRYWYTVKNDGINKVEKVDEEMDFLNVRGMQEDNLKVFCEGPVVWEFGVLRNGKVECLRMKKTGGHSKLEGTKWDFEKKVWGQPEYFDPTNVQDVIKIRVTKDPNDPEEIKAEFGWLP